MLHTVLASSLPNGHAGKQMLLLLTMASGIPASNLPGYVCRVLRAQGKGWQRLRG
jgi:hypothetical protein